MSDPIKPTTETDHPNLSTEHQQQGDARRPSDRLDKDQPQGETIPRKSSLLHGD
ncbi:hypothetical protein [Sphingomonas bacterium]|uniref:hypothetical protein n=1 Tax=Sphingomonas bacterium TaxID=1895847 RepID=UPI001576B1EE|nr:hypothetical protein [Sphingomonas bacterium]